MTNLANVQNSETQAQQNSANKFNLSLIELVNHQQALQKQSTDVIFKLSNLQSQHKNDNILADL